MTALADEDDRPGRYHWDSSIAGLSRTLGTDGFGTHYRLRRDGSIGLDSEAALPRHPPSIWQPMPNHSEHV